MGDRLYPQLGNGGYDVGHYAIDLRFAPAENHITAETTISAIATQDLSSFNLDFYGLTVQSVDVNGHLAEFARHNSELVITPSVPLLRDREFTVTLAYDRCSGTTSGPGCTLDAARLARMGRRLLRYTQRTIRRNELVPQQ